MECHKCDHEMIIEQYIEFEDLMKYLETTTYHKPNMNYHDWLKDLKEGDVVLTRFTKSEYGKTVCKYYLRIVESNTFNGIKLGYLSKFFNIESGELKYESNSRIKESDTTYKILEIDSVSDLIIRKHCASKEKYSIKKLNNELSKAIIGIM